MIYHKEDGDVFDHVVDLIRPDLTNETEFRNWEDIHAWIKSDTTPPVVINGAFRFIEAMLAERQGYMGGGFSYSFWFETEADLDAFKQMVDGLSWEHDEPIP